MSSNIKEVVNLDKLINSKEVHLMTEPTIEQSHLCLRIDVQIINLIGALITDIFKCGLIISLLVDLDTALFLFCLLET